MKKIEMPESIRRISEGWCFTAPFFQTFLQNFHYFEADDNDNVDTIAVSAIRGKLMMITSKGNAWFDQFDMDVQKGIIVHEIMHLISGHLLRGRNLINQIFNIAADVCINEKILESTINGKKMVLPEEGCFRKNVLPDNWKNEDMVSEKIYDYLIKEIQNAMKNMPQMSMSGMGGGDMKQDQNQDGDGEGEGEGNGQSNGNGENKDGKGGKGNSKGKENKDGKGGKGNKEDKGGKGNSKGKNERTMKIGDKEVTTMDSHGKLEEAANDELSQQAIGQLVDKARNTGYGTISNNMVTFIEELLKPMVNWRKLLRNFVTSLDKGMRKTDTWRRANRRELPLMGKQKVGSEILLLIDSSGSVFSEEVFSQFFTEIEKIQSLGFNIHLFCCDTELYDLGKYRKGGYKNIKVKGGGGTVMDPMFDWMRDNKKLKNKLVILTDGYMSYDYIKTNYSTVDALWVVTPDGSNESGFGSHKFVKMSETNN